MTLIDAKKLEEKIEYDLMLFVATGGTDVRTA